jgi:hypothetical protein
MKKLRLTVSSLLLPASLVYSHPGDAASCNSNDFDCYNGVQDSSQEVDKEKSLEFERIASMRDVSPPEYMNNDGSSSFSEMRRPVMNSEEQFARPVMNSGEQFARPVMNSGEQFARPVMNSGEQFAHSLPKVNWFRGLPIF